MIRSVNHDLPEIIKRAVIDYFIGAHVHNAIADAGISSKIILVCHPGLVCPGVDMHGDAALRRQSPARNAGSLVMFPEPGATSCGEQLFVNELASTATRTSALVEKILVAKL